MCAHRARHIAFGLFKAEARAKQTITLRLQPHSAQRESHTAAHGALNIFLFIYKTLYFLSFFVHIQIIVSALFFFFFWLRSTRVSNSACFACFSPTLVRLVRPEKKDLFLFLHFLRVDCFEAQTSGQIYAIGYNLAWQQQRQRQQSSTQTHIQPDSEKKELKTNILNNT